MDDQVSQDWQRPRVDIGAQKSPIHDGEKDGNRQQERDQGEEHPLFHWAEMHIRLKESPIDQREPDSGSQVERDREGDSISSGLDDWVMGQIPGPALKLVACLLADRPGRPVGGGEDDAEGESRKEAANRAVPEPAIDSLSMRPGRPRLRLSRGDAANMSVTIDGTGGRLRHNVLPVFLNRDVAVPTRTLIELTPLRRNWLFAIPIRLGYDRARGFAGPQWGRPPNLMRGKLLADGVPTMLLHRCGVSWVPGVTDRQPDGERGSIHRGHSWTRTNPVRS